MQGTNAILGLSSQLGPVFLTPSQGSTEAEGTVMFDDEAHRRHITRSAWQGSLSQPPASSSASSEAEEAAGFQFLGILKGFSA